MRSGANVTTQLGTGQRYLKGPLEQQLRRWIYIAAMRQRNITLVDVGAEIGKSRQRVQQILERFSPDDEERLSAAITAITERRAGELGGLEDDDVLTVIVGAVRERFDPRTATRDPWHPSATKGPTLGFSADELVAAMQRGEEWLQSRGQKPKKKAAA